MPSDAALDALARIANLVTDPADVVRMRCVELLACGGWRINELLDVPVECEVWDPVFVNGEPVLGTDGEQVRRYGIRYFAEKGGAPGVKWIPTAMVDVARRAIADVRRLTEPARAVATWSAANPGRAWLPDRWRGLPLDTEVTSVEVEEMFGVDNGAQQLNTWGIGERRSGRVLTALGRLEQALLERMPPIRSGARSVLRHECLFLMPLRGRCSSATLKASSDTHGRGKRWSGTRPSRRPTKLPAIADAVPRYAASREAPPRRCCSGALSPFRRRSNV